MERKRVVYLVPLKFLAEEKYLDFKKKYQHFGIKVVLRLRRITGSMIADSNTYPSFNASDVMVCHRSHATAWVTPVQKSLLSERKTMALTRDGNTKDEMIYFNPTTANRRQNRWVWLEWQPTP